VRGDLDWKGGVIGPRPAEIKDLATFSGPPYGELPPNQAFVNREFTAGWEDGCRHTSWPSDLMAIGLFRKSAPQPAAPEPQAVKPAAPAEAVDTSEAESSKQILELLGFRTAYKL
jgi:hypothetical protein